MQPANSPNLKSCGLPYLGVIPVYHAPLQDVVELRKQLVERLNSSRE